MRRAPGVEVSAKIVAVAYDDVEMADRALERIRGLEEGNQLALEDAAVVVRGEDGSISHHSLGDQPGDRVQGGAIGALTGTLVGMLFGPVGAVVGMLGGGAIGAQHWHEVAITESFVEELANGLQPGSSAIVVLGEEEELTFLASKVPADIRGRIISTDLDDEQVTRLRKVAGR